MAEIPTSLTSQDIVPEAMSTLWPDSVPVHAMTIAAVLRPDGKQAIQVLHNSDATVWVLLGMLDCVSADLRDAWVSYSWKEADDDDDDE